MPTDKELRKRILGIFYRRSGGNSSEPVDDFRVARELNVDSRNLEGVFRYLSDKGYLESFSIGSHTITHLGIDEVDNDFRNLSASNNPKEAVVSQVTIGNLHLGQGDITSFNASDGSSNNFSFDDVPRWAKLLASIVPLLALFWGIYIYFFPSVPNFIYGQKYSTDLATSSLTLNEVFKKKDTYSTSLDKQNFVKTYADEPLPGVGILKDVQKEDQGYLLQMDVENNAVACEFGFDHEKEILLLNPGQSIKFSGIFTTSGIGFYQGISPWYMKNCNFTQ